MTRNSPEPSPDGPLRVLVVGSTFPASADDPVPTFVRDLVLAIKRHDPAIEFTVLAPHDPRSSTPGLTRHEEYDEYRFQYFWPRRAQLLAGRGGIVPSLQRNKALYLLVPFFLLAEWVALRRLVRRIRPHVTNVHWIIPQGVVAAFARIRKRAPIVMTIHGGDVFTFNNALAVRLKRSALKAAAHVVVNSSATRVRTVDFASGPEPIVIPMGVDLGEFEVDRPAGTAERLNVLFVGRLSEEKGVLDLLDALAKLRADGVPFSARIVGTGPQGAELYDRAGVLGLRDDVEFLGWVPRLEIGTHYAWADVFAGPSITAKTGWMEALGVVFIEAAASGLPVVTTDAGGMRDIVLDQVTGYIVPERTPERIAEALAVLAGDPELRERLGQAGQAHVRAGFAWPAIAGHYATMFRSVAAGEPFGARP